MRFAARSISLFALTGFALAALSAPPSVFAETTPTTTTPTTTAPAPALPAPPPNPIRVGLGKGLTTATISAPQGITVIAEGAIVHQVPAGTALQVDLAGGKVRIAAVGKEWAGPVRLVPVSGGPVATAQVAPEDSIVEPDPSVRPPGWTRPLPTPPPAPANPIGYKGRNYRGEIEVLVAPSNARLSVVNVVNLEDYLLSVVAREVYASWPMESLKAQAVAARNYTKRHLGRFVADGYDVTDSPESDQDYPGLKYEQLTTSQAVMQTRGQVLTYGTGLAVTYYHSSSGGYTENNEIIWNGAPVPYLRGVPDYDNVQGNTRYAWQSSFTPAEFTQKVTAAGLNVGQVITVAPAGQMGVSGRPSLWRLIGFSSSVDVTAEQFRRLLGLASSPRNVAVTAAGEAPGTRTYSSGESFTVVSAGGVQSTRSVTGTRVVGAGGTTATIAAGASAIGQTVTQEGGFTVTGGGFGHGVGMSQWGAYGMAQQGKTYVEILTHYYQGTKVETR